MRKFRVRLIGQERELGEGRQQCQGQAPLALFLFFVSFPDPCPDSTATANPRRDLGRARKLATCPSRMENMARWLLERF